MTHEPPDGRQRRVNSYIVVIDSVQNISPAIDLIGITPPEEPSEALMEHQRPGF